MNVTTSVYLKGYFQSGLNSVRRYFPKRAAQLRRSQILQHGVLKTLSHDIIGNFSLQ
jgi:hypothetical protein